MKIEPKTLKRKREETENLDELFDFSKNKKKKKQSSSVSKSSNGGVAFITTNKDDASNASHLIKIEIYDLSEIAKLPASDHWKNTKMRIKYYTTEKNKIFDEINKAIYNITKEISSEDSSKKMLFNK